MKTSRGTYKLCIDKLRSISRKTWAILVILIILALWKKVFFLIAVFYILDFFKSIIKCKVTFVPIDLTFVFGVTAAYYYNPFIAVTIYALGHVNRLVFGFTQTRHLSEIFRNLLIFFITPLFVGQMFLPAAFILIILKYVLRFVIDIGIFGDLSVIKKIPFFAINVIGSILLFYVIDELKFLII